jgi:hypothetical protein
MGGEAGDELVEQDAAAGLRELVAGATILAAAKVRKPPRHL